LVDVFANPQRADQAASSLGGDVRRDAVHPGHELEELAPAEFFIDKRQVGHVGELGAGLLAILTHELAADADLAGVRAQKTYDHFDRRGLSSSVWPEKRKDLARPDVERHAVDGGLFAEPLADAFEDDGHQRSPADSRLRPALRSCV